MNETAEPRERGNQIRKRRGRKRKREEKWGENDENFWGPKALSFTTFYKSLPFPTDKNIIYNQRQLTASANTLQILPDGQSPTLLRPQISLNTLLFLYISNKN